MKKVFFTLCLPLILISGLILSLLIFVSCTEINDETYDIAILDGLIFVGDGSSAFQTDIGIRGEKIAKIGEIEIEEAVEIIDAQGLCVSPGFIDIHTHTDRNIEDIPTAINYILQGVTTVLGGNCGSYRYPLDELFQKLETQGIAINFCSLVGHNSVRWQVMEYRQTPGREEMEQMKAIIEQEMRNGAIGFSTGLVYRPGLFSTTDEVIELAGAAAKYGGIYASHTRNGGVSVNDAVKEAILIGESNNMRIQISHIKLAHPYVWGHPELISDPINEARSRGIRVTTDQYPYNASAASFYSWIPPWAFGEGWDDFLRFLESPENYEALKSHYTPIFSFGLERIYITYYDVDSSYQGKNFKEILIMKGIEPTAENAAELLIEIQRIGSVSGIFFTMEERDVEDLMRLDYTMIASDGHLLNLGEEGLPHPRNYGTFPRIISRYVKEKGTLSLGDAIRKMTLLPAQSLELRDRGTIKEGLYADLVIFDLKTIRDTSTFSDPHHYPEGIRYVIVNGEIAAYNGTLTGVLAGKVIYGPGFQSSNSFQFRHLF